MCLKVSKIFLCLFFLASIVSIELTIASNHEEKSTKLDFVPVETLYNSCGVSAGCFGCDENFICVQAASMGCIRDKSCTYFAHYDLSSLSDRDEIRFTVFRKMTDVSNPQWVGMGISQKTKMVIISKKQKERREKISDQQMLDVVFTFLQ